MSAADQFKMESRFVNQLPWKSFGRKNAGYLYAISQGANVIWDFDDDNMLKFWMKDASPDPVMDIDNFNAKGGTGKPQTMCKKFMQQVNLVDGQS